MYQTFKHPYVLASWFSRILKISRKKGWKFNMISGPHSQSPSNFIAYRWMAVMQHDS